MERIDTPAGDKKSNHSQLSKDSRYLVLFALSIFVLAYFVPVLLYQTPSGSDAVTHIYFTRMMTDSRSLNEFYEKSFISENLGQEYPFGMWFFGSLIMKVTGMDVFEFVFSFTVLLIIITLIGFYVYSKHLLDSTNKSILSLIFLLSMPLLVTNLLIYSTRGFMMIFLIFIVYFSVQELNLRNIIILPLLVFSMVFSHTGTYMFLLFFAIAYFLLAALVWKKFETGMFYLIVISLVLYVLTVHLFPFVLPQYIDKGRMIVTLTGSLSKILRVNQIQNMGLILYENVFVSNNISYALFWSCLVYTFGKLALFTHDRIKFLSERKSFAIPFISNIQSVSHGIVTTPVWIGPVQTLLTIPGIIAVNARTKCIALALFFAAILPSAFQSSEGTGALREIYYLYLIIPITAAAGFYTIVQTIGRSGPLSIGRFKIIKSLSGPSRKRLIIIFYLIVFLPLLISPIVGNIHYQPQISGTANEKENLIWLSGIGNPNEGVPGYYYRERINLYANKAVPSIPEGSETRRYLDDLKNSFFSSNAEAYTRDLRSFGIKYLIFSRKIVSGFGIASGFLMANSNQLLDDIYASDNNYGIYQYVSPPVKPVSVTTRTTDIEFVESNSSIQDLDPLFIFENDYYKVKLSHSSPQIRYIGTKIENFLGEGAFSDTVTISWPGTADEGFATYDLSELSYPSIEARGNSIRYQTTIRNENQTKNWATLIVEYSFFERAVRRKITVANDWTGSGSAMNVQQSSSIFAPFSEFSFNQITYPDETVVNKVVYPSQDSVILRDKKFDDAHFKKDDTGLLIRYSDSAPYPSMLSYRGSTLYDYSSVSLRSDCTLSPSEPITQVQFFSIGDRNTAGKNIDIYMSISSYEFPKAEIPIAVIGLFDSKDGAGFPHAGVSLIQNYDIRYNELILPGQLFGSEATVTPIMFMDISKETSRNLDISTELKDLQDRFDATGILFQYFKYNLGAIQAVSVNGFQFIPAYSVPPPLMEFNREGLRNPKIGYYHGEETGLVLLPVATPFSSNLNSYSNSDEIFGNWNETLNSVVHEGGMALFLWDARDVGNPQYRDEFESILTSSRSMGMNSSDLTTLASHFKSIQNISVKVTKGLDYVILDANNLNQEYVSGVTYRIILPAFENICPYHAVNGEILRNSITGETCTLYINFDIKSSEQKRITIEPDIQRQRFKKDLPVIYEGETRITVKDEKGNRVKNASILVDSQRFDANSQGEALISMTRGSHRIVIEKPGFFPEEYTIDVKGKVFKVLNVLGIR